MIIWFSDFYYCIANSFSVIPYELVDEAANDPDYASDYDLDTDEEEAIFNRISNY